jgi:hypothetical protein
MSATSSVVPLGGDHLINSTNDDALDGKSDPPGDKKPKGQIYASEDIKMNPLAYSLVPEDGHNATNDAVGYYTYLKEALAAKAKIPSADTGKTRQNVCDALKEEGVVV